MDIKYKTAIRNLFYLLKQRLKLFIFFAFVITLTSVLEAIGIGSLYPIMDTFGDESKRVAYVNKIGHFLPFDFSGDQFIIILFLGTVIVFLTRCIFLIFTFYLQFRLSEKLTAEWQTEIFRSYLNQKYDYFIRHQTGDLIQRQMVHTIEAGNSIMFSCQLARDFLVVMFLYILLCVISLKVTLMITAIFLVFALFSLKFSKSKIYVLSQEHARLQKKAYSISAEVIAGIRQVKAFLAEGFFKGRFSSIVKEKAAIYIKIGTFSKLPQPIMQTLAIIGVVTTLYFVSKHTKSPDNLIPMIVVFGGGLFRIVGSLAGVNTNFMQLSHTLPSVCIVSDLLSQKQDCKELKEIALFNNSIKIENAYFSYSNNEFRLYDVNIEFKKGRFYGVVGPSGSGKSTLVDLIIRFYSLQRGRVLIDDNEIESIDIHSWRRQIGLISQETFIFNSTVEENISFGADLSKIDRDKVIASAKIADIYEFINGLPDGFQTIVGERGLKLSGGQRQRLAIARAVYRDPEIYIFDEATSALDTSSEKRIQKSIENLSRTKTVIVIAHRLSTVVKADEIIVLKEGNIVEKGNHHELLSKQGLYAEMYGKQYKQE
jgi:ABC-type multidrug transport system fused ATPase/permease subunit